MSNIAWMVTVLQATCLLVLIVNWTCILAIGWLLWIVVTGIEVDPYLRQRLHFTYRHTLGSRRLGIWKTWKMSYGVFHGSAMKLVEDSRKWTVV